MNVTIAVIDSGIDVKHPELANSVADSFDALGSKEGPHVHGTGIAGAIVAHARLMGSAPEARLLAIRAFGGASGGAESTSYVILKGLDYAVEHGAQIVNMSFAGPKDPLIERGIAATAARGILLVAAAGNAGAKSPPLYPAANPNVIAVSGTDAQEQAVRGVEPRQLHRDRRARRGYLPAGAGRKIPDHVGHLVFRRLCQRHRGADHGAQSGVEAERCSRDPDQDRPRSRRPRPRRSVRGGRGRCLCRGHRRRSMRPRFRWLRRHRQAGRRKTPAPAASDNASVSRALNDSAPSLSSDKSAANDANRPLRADFRQSPPTRRVKKIARRFERSPRVLRLINVGAVIPPHRLYSARAPIHPKRPYGLTRPVVPPDGSFTFGGHFPEKRSACNAVPGGALTLSFTISGEIAVGWRCATRACGLT